MAFLKSFALTLLIGGVLIGVVWFRPGSAPEPDVPSLDELREDASDPVGGPLVMGLQARLVAETRDVVAGEPVVLRMELVHHGPGDATYAGFNYEDYFLPVCSLTLTQAFVAVEAAAIEMQDRRDPVRGIG